MPSMNFLHCSKYPKSLTHRYQFRENVVTKPNRRRNYFCQEQRPPQQRNEQKKVMAKNRNIKQEKKTEAKSKSEKTRIKHEHRHFVVLGPFDVGIEFKNIKATTHQTNVI